MANQPTSRQAFKRLPVWPHGVSHAEFGPSIDASQVAGIDEAGRGPWAGPVVAAAVILPRSSLPVRIDDSKRLTPKQREAAFDCIIEEAVVGFGVVSPRIIDERNILQATMLAMRLAFEDLDQTPSVALVDGNKAPSLSAPCIAVVKGDSRSLAIASASIMAKVARDRLMAFYHELEPRYSFHVHKGYGTALHHERLKEHGPSLFHRLSFSPIKALMGFPDAPVQKDPETETDLQAAAWAEQ